MKWFKHFSDSHGNGKMRQILRKHGLEGYAFCWICRELIAKEGNGKYRISSEKDWKQTLCDIVKKSIIEVEEWLKYQAEINIIDRKALEIGDLYIPKLKEYGDEYSVRKSGECRENIVLDKIRLDKIILEYIAIKGWQDSIKDNTSLKNNIWKRNVKAAKQLILIAHDDSKAIEAIKTMSIKYKEKGLDWTLETVISHYPELIKSTAPVWNDLKPR